MTKNRLQTERIDNAQAFFGAQVHNESNKLPGHENRMKALCERIQREYFDKGLNRAGRPKNKV